jgi:PAB1-binding protein PBP1
MTPATPPPLSPTATRSPHNPRVARSHRRKGNVSRVKYPQGGYAPFQPLVMPPQSSATVPPLPTMTGIPAGGVYFITPSPPQSQNGDGTAAGQAATGNATAGPVQFSPVMVQYVPATLRPDGVPAMVSAAHGNLPVTNMMMVSPPATPQKPTGSHSAHHSRQA